MTDQLKFSKLLQLKIKFKGLRVTIVLTQKQTDINFGLNVKFLHDNKGVPTSRSVRTDNEEWHMEVIELKRWFTPLLCTDNYT